MSIDEILAKVNGQESEEQDQEETTTPDSPSETEEEQEEPSQEGDEAEDTDDDNSDDSENTPDEKDIPFHKHPRWKQKQQEVEELKQQVEELRTVKTQPEVPQSRDDEPLPQWVLGLGNGTETPELRSWYKTYTESTKAERESLRQEVISEIKKEQEQKEKEVEKWNNWVEEESTRVLEGEKGITKNELLKAANDFQPVDANGNISFEKALQIVKMQKAQKPDSSEQKKKIASTTTGGQRGTSQNRQVNTPHTLRNSDFYDLA